MCKVQADFEIFEAKKAVEVIDASDVIMSVEVIKTAEVFRTTLIFGINKLIVKITFLLMF